MSYRITSSRLPAALIAVLVVTAAGLAAALSPWGRALDRYAYDMFFCLRGERASAADIVIVAVDEASFGVIGRQWPWPRRIHAGLIDSLGAAGAGTIAVDILFAGSSDPDDDAALAAAIQRHPDVVLAETVETVEEKTHIRQVHTRPLASLLSGRTRIGVDTMPLDPDGFVRRCVPVFPNAVLFAAAAVNQPGVLSYLQQNGPAEPFLQDRLINFVGPPRSVETVSYYQALDPERYLPGGFFEGRMVFVGFNLKTPVDPSRGRPDHYPVPFVSGGAGTMAGVEIQATVAENLLGGGFIIPLGPVRTAAAALVVFLAAVGITRRFTPAGAAAGILALTGVTGVALFFMFSQRNLYGSPVTILVPALAAWMLSLVNRYRTLFLEKQRIRRTFSRYVSPGVVKHLLEHSMPAGAASQRVEATILFLDIQDFSTLVQKASPDDLIDILNRYLGGFADIVLQEQGTIDKIVGDGIMAVWGVPEHRPDHALMACRAALAMAASLKDLCRKDEEARHPGLTVRIGINSGRVIAGSVEGKKFANFTVHGEDVNVAVRLEAVNKLYGTGILAGENTVALAAGGDLVFREIDVVSIRGKKKPQVIYELVGQRREIDRDRQAFLEQFHQARELYKRRQWPEAAGYFEQCLERFPDDTPSWILLERCRRLQEEMPGDDWDGVQTIRI